MLSGVLWFGTSGSFIDVLLVRSWLQCLGSFQEQVEDRPVLRLESALLGIGQALGGKLEGSEIEEDVAGAREALLETGGKRPDQRGALRVGTHDRERFRQQACPLTVRGCNPKRRNQGERFVLTQRVALHGADEVLLAFFAHGAQRIGERRADRPLVDFAFDVRSKFRGEGQPAHDPRLAPAQELCNACQAEPILVEQGPDDTRLIHWRRRARRRVRTQEQQFLLDPRAGALDNCRHDRSPLVRPASESFEAVDDFEITVSRLNDSDGKVSELWRRVSPHLNAPQPLMARTYESKRNRAHEFRGLVRQNCVDRRHRHHRCGSHGSAR
jgi:hypothetical protein